MAKPILSTRVMKLHKAFGDYHDYWQGGRLMLCVDAAAGLFDFKRESPPARVSLHVYEEPGDGRVCLHFRYLASAEYPEVQYCAPPDTFWAYIYERLGKCLLELISIGSRLRAGKTVTLYVALEIVKEAK